MPTALRLTLFLVVFSSVMFTLHYVLYRRLVLDTTVDPRLRRWGLWVFGALGASVFLSRLISPLMPPPLGTAYLTSVFVWLGLAILLFTVLVGFSALSAMARVSRAVAGGKRGKREKPERLERPEKREEREEVDDPSRRLFLSRAVAGTALAASGLAGGFGLYRAYGPPAVRELSLKLARLPRALDGLAIVHLSDLHVGGAIDERYVMDVVRRVQALKPDVVAITGDLVDGSVAELGATVALLGRIRARFGTFFVTGNHEYYSGADAWTQALPRMGVRVLRNGFTRLGDAGGELEIVGVDDWSQRGRGGYDLDAALAGSSPDALKVLLAHQPTNWEVAASRGVDLQLSGHTHGGQFFPGTMLIPMIWRYPAGHYSADDARSHLFVSRGTGFWGPPMRLGTESEIVKLVLTHT